MLASLFDVRKEEKGITVTFSPQNVLNFRENHEKILPFPFPFLDWSLSLMSFL